jgi:hypothetical protein
LLPADDCAHPCFLQRPHEFLRARGGVPESRYCAARMFACSRSSITTTSIALLSPRPSRRHHYRLHMPHSLPPTAGGTTSGGNADAVVEKAEEVCARGWCVCRPHCSDASICVFLRTCFCKIIILSPVKSDAAFRQALRTKRQQVFFAPQIVAATFHLSSKIYI